MISASLIQRTLDGMHQGCMLLGFDWTYLYVNEAAARHGRTTRDELLGRRMTDVYPGVETTEVFAHYRRCMEERAAHAFESGFTFADGQTQHYQFIVEPAPEGILVLSVDITERRRAEDALHATEARYRALFDLAPVGMADVETATGCIVRVNDRLCEVLGRSREELTRSRWQGISHPDDIASDLEAHRQMRATGLPVTKDKRYLRADGTVIFARITIAPIVRAGDEVAHHIAIIEDVSAERAAQADLAAKDAELQAASRALLLHHQVREAILRAGTETDLFDAVCRVFVETGGYRMAWVGIVEHDERKSIRPVAHAGHDDGYLGSVDVVWSDTEHGRGPAGTAVRERRVVTGAYFARDPSLRPWSAEALKRGYQSSSAIPVLLDGRAIALVSVYSAEPEQLERAELTVLRELGEDLALGVAALRRQEALRASEAKYRFLFDNAAAAMFSSRLDGGAIVDANERFLEILGCSREEAIGLPAGRFWADASERDAMMRRLRAEGAVHELEYRIRRSDGEERTCLLSASLFADQQVFEGSIVDITDRKRADALLARTQRLESLGTLAAGIAHDFNNLLTGVLGNLSLLSVAPAADRDELVREAEAAAVRAQSLTRQLLTFSRGGAPTKSVVDLGRVVREAARFVSRGAATQCRLELPVDSWPVEADPGQIAQVVQNLVLNALEATPGGDTIDVSLANEEVLEERRGCPPGRYVRVRVTDHGVGIPEQSLARIFDPFFSTKNRGSGLGLSVAHSIVLRHGGAIEVRSRPGTGTTFDVLLPAHSGAPVPEGAEPVTKGGIGARVLLMDDEEALRRVASRALSSAGCEVEVAAHGVHAVELWKQARSRGQPFDLVLVDLTVPGGMGGVEALACLKEIDPDVRVLASSGYSEDPVMAAPAEHGFVGALAKPWSARDLRNVVLEHVGRGRALRTTT